MSQTVLRFAKTPNSAIKSQKPHYKLHYKNILLYTEPLLSHLCSRFLVEETSETNRTF